MIVTIHQPNFAPWTGYFDKMVKADVFVLLDTVAFTKGGFQNRVKILGNDGPQWLTIPVITKGRLGQPTNQVQTNEARSWREDHAKTLQTLYAKAPNVDTAITMLREVYANPSTQLADLCVDLISRLASHYAITTQLVRSSELQANGSSSALLAEIVAELGGTTYLSGPSGRHYLDEHEFTRRGIAVQYHAFTPTPYPQAGRQDFTAGLSMLDHLAQGASAWWSPR